MTQVIRGPSEPFDSLLRRFTRKVSDDGIIAEFKRREAFESKSDKIKRKKAKARSRSKRQQSE
jgi:small subunit ribosomal protein S21